MKDLIHSISEQSLTIFLWCTCKPHTLAIATQDSFYPRYLFYDYGIDTPQELHNVLLSSGYYAPATLDDILSYSNSKQLKAILKENSLKITGDKATLISRIKEYIPQSVLEDFQANSHLYSLSTLGSAYVNEHYDCVLLHKYSKWNISLDELNHAKATLNWDSVSFRDAAWRILNERVLLHSQEADFDNLYLDIENLSEICFDFDNSPLNGVYYLLIAFYLNVNCLEYYPTYKLYHDGVISKENLYSLQNGLFILDFWVDKIKKYGNYIDSSLIAKAYNFVDYPIKLYTLEDFSNMISEIIFNNCFDIKKWQNFSQEKFIKFLNSLS